MGGCQNHGPFLGTLNIRCRIILGTQKGIIILTTTHVLALRSEEAGLLEGPMSHFGVWGLAERGALSCIEVCRGSRHPIQVEQNGNYNSRLG